MIRNPAVTAAAYIAVILFLTGLLTGCGETAESFRFELVSEEVSAGSDARIAVRVIGPDGAPVAASKIRLVRSRLDMGPDGMAGMEAALRAIPSDHPDRLSFTADITMPGRWALTLEAEVEGAPAFVTGEILITAGEPGATVPSGESESGERRILYYRNPMGLADISEVPKRDSMGMEYIPVYADEVAGPAGLVRVSPEKVQRAGVRITRATLKNLMREIRGAGTVTPDEGRIMLVAPRFDGYVEDLFGRRTGDRVEAGAPLFSAWIEADSNAGEDTDDLLRMQADYVTALRAGSDDAARAANNLRQFGIPQSFIEELTRTRKPARSVTMSAPLDGTILEKVALDGMRFSSGDVLFKIADLSHVWLIVAVSEQDIGFVQSGQSATIRLSAMPGESFSGTVTFVYPSIDAVTRTGRIRIEVANSDGRIKINSYGQVTIAAPVGESPSVTVPASAIIDDGTRRLVFVARGEGYFEPRSVVLGARGGDEVAVLSGLAEGEQVVSAGTFLIDAESNLQAALSAFTAETTEP